MDAIFINSKNSSNFDPHRLILNHTDTINLKRSEKYVVYQSYYILYIKKYIKVYTKTIDLKLHLQHGMVNLNYLMDHILYQVFKIILIKLFSKIMKL